MKWHKILFFYWILTSCNLLGSKIESAYEALSIYDYFKAKKLFYSQLQKQHKAAAAYGLANIFHRTDNPFSSGDSASKYITLAGNYFKAFKQQESYFGYIIDSTHIAKLADSIASFAYRKIPDVTPFEEWEKFIVKNPFAPTLLKFNALKKRDYLCFNQNRQYNSSDSTRLILIKYPESYYYAETLLLLDRQLFDENTSAKNTDSYIHFISRFPGNRFISKAEDELFQLYKKNNDVQGLEFYIHHYKNSRFYGEAWKLLYALTVKSYNNEELTGFMKAYPEFPFKESINKEIELNNKLLIPLNDSDYVGFIDTSGAFVIPPIFDAATPFKEGLTVVTKNDTAYFINKENKNLFNAFYSEAFPFYNGLAPVNKNGIWFLINRQGQEVAGPFDDLSEQSELVYSVKINNKYGAIDVYGNFVVQPKFDQLGDFKNGKAYFVQNGSYGFITKNGFISVPRFQWISDFDENNIAIVKKYNLYGLVNDNDSLFLNARYELILKADNSNFILVRNNKYGFYSSKNCFVTDVDNDFKKELSPSYYTNGKNYKLIKNKKQAVMDANGKITVDFGLFDEVYFAKSNLIRVKRKNKFGFADRKLNLVIPCKYIDAGDFNDSVAICKTKKGTVLINVKGEEIFKSSGNISLVYKNIFLSESPETNTLFDKNGKIIYPDIETCRVISNEGYDNGGVFILVTFVNGTKKLIKP